MDSFYSSVITESLKEQLLNLKEDEFILESNLKRDVYTRKQIGMLPLHTYLKIKNISFCDAIQMFCDKKSC